MAKLTQKFLIGQKVHIAKDLGSSMRHFTSDVDAIVLYSYNDRYGGGNTNQYGLGILGKNGKIKFCSSWYWANQLTLMSDDRLLGLDLIQDYNLRDRER